MNTQTKLGKEIPKDIRGILYLCDYQGGLNAKITIIREIMFTDGFEALEAYGNIPNPTSQLASGKTYDKMIKELDALHRNLNNPEWVKGLSEYL